MKQNYGRKFLQRCFLKSSLIFLSLFFLPTHLLFAVTANSDISSKLIDNTGVSEYNDIKAFTEAFAQIQENYVETVPDDQLLQGAIRGMVEALDPHSSYLNPAELRQLQEVTEGEFGGIGIEVVENNNTLVIIKVLPNTPSSRAQLKAGDIIYAINGQVITKANLAKSIDQLRGIVGSFVELTIQREQTKPRTLRLQRAMIFNQSVDAFALNENIGYVRVNQFQLRTAFELRRALENLQKQLKPMKSVILDLRNNPGGLLQAAVQSASLFIKEGLVVYTEGRSAADNARFQTDYRLWNDQLPLVVLINGSTASAAEILAGALQDHKRAILLGTKSFGKGSIQTIMPLANGGGLKLTTAFYFTPSGRSIQVDGITPDLYVNQETLMPSNQTDQREINLSRHLPNQNESPASKPQVAERSSAVLATDYQLQQAYNLSKALSLLENNKR